MTIEAVRWALPVSVTYLRGVGWANEAALRNAQVNPPVPAPSCLGLAPSFEAYRSTIRHFAGAFGGSGFSVRLRFADGYCGRITSGALGSRGHAQL